MKRHLENIRARLVRIDAVLVERQERATRRNSRVLLEQQREEVRLALVDVDAALDALKLVKAALPAAFASSRPPADRAARDVLHPDGRCTCAGEGKCDWCERIGNRIDDALGGSPS